MTRVLVVGCGGIGCELIKLLPYSGVSRVTLVDMDRVELSNLNRQFIFSSESIGKFKAACCKEYLERRLGPGSVEAVNESIIDPVRFGVPFMAGFDILVNALDNLPARQYVAEMSRLACVPLVDVGTAGLRGSVGVYYPQDGGSECFHCYSKQGGQQSFPVCTIRSRPTQPQHCVAYARILCGKLFSVEGESELDDYPSLWPPREGASRLGEQDDAAAMREICRVFDSLFDLMLAENPATVRRFSSESMLAAVGDELAAEAPPSVGLEPSAKMLLSSGWKPSLQQLALFASRFTPFGTEALQPHHCFAVFMSACSSILKRIATRSSSEASLQPQGGAYGGYSKDDDDSVMLMAAMATLRAHNFGLAALKGPFDLNAIAGAIIPAVSYSNALVAAIAAKAIRRILTEARGVSGPSGGKSFFFTTPNHPTVVADDPNPKNPGCEICSQGLVYLGLPDEMLSAAGDSDGISSAMHDACSNLLLTLSSEGIVTEPAGVYFKGALLAEKKPEGSAEESSSEESGWGEALEGASGGDAQDGPAVQAARSEQARFYPGQVLHLLAGEAAYSVVVLPVESVRAGEGPTMKCAQGEARVILPAAKKPVRVSAGEPAPSVQEAAGRSIEGGQTPGDFSISSVSDGYGEASAAREVPAGRGDAEGAEASEISID